MSDAELRKLNELIGFLDDAIDKHVRELASLAERNGYGDQAIELNLLLKHRISRNSRRYHSVNESLSEVETALECSMRELSLVSRYLSNRVSKRRNSNETTVPPMEAVCSEKTGERPSTTA